MTTQLDEFSLNLPITQTPSTSIGDDYAMDPSYADQAAAVMSSPSAPETSVVIGDPATAVDSRMVSVFANNISPVSYGQEGDGIAFTGSIQEYVKGFHGEDVEQRIENPPQIDYGVANPRDVKILA